MTREMNDAEKAELLDERIRKGGAVFCPWCHRLNRVGDEMNPCCRAFAFAVRERSDAMVRSFANQYTAVECGTSSSITCPFCREVNRAPAPLDPADWKRPLTSPFCCSWFEHALAAHLEVKRVNSLVHRADQIAEALDKAARN